MDWKDQFERLFCDRDLGPEGLEGAQALKAANLPDRLYKYCDTDQLDRGLEVLTSGNVWLSAPKTFNDPFDSVASFDVERLFSEVATSKPDPERPASLLVRMTRGEAPFGSEDLRQGLLPEAKTLYGKATDWAARAATTRLQSNLGVTCFSETHLNAPMWAHYAAHHQGFCIEWRAADWKHAPDHLENLFPVLYDSTPFQMPSLIFNPHHERADVLLALRKGLDWSYEREWRYVARLPPQHTTRLQQLPRPSAIHLGSKIAPELRSRLVAACRSAGLEVFEVRWVLERGYLESRLVSKH